MPLPEQQVLSEELLEMIQEQVLEGVGTLDVHSDLFDYGLDSMAIMQLLLLIEGRYGFMPSASDLTRENFTTTEDLARLLTERFAEPK